MKTIFWIARDKDGWPFLHSEKPQADHNGFFFSRNGKGVGFKIPKDLFPEVTWENSPQQVELKLIEK